MNSGTKIESLVTTTQKVEHDWTRISDYSQLVEEEIQEYSNIEVTDNLREGGIHAQNAWRFWFEYLSERVWKTSLAEEIMAFCDDIVDPRILSLGCGYGGIELDIAKSLKSTYQITAVDLNPGILDKARAEAQAKNLNIQFLPLDLNFLQIKEKSFDLIIAHASLHHILNLEHVFSQIHMGLKDHGRLIVQDIIGKTQVLFWKQNVDFAIDLVHKMPPKYGAGIELPPYSEPAIQIGMEGIRQEEIEPLLNDYFVPTKMFKYGSFMRMVCTHPDLGKRFDPGIEADKRYLQSLFDLDVQQVEEGRLRATEMLAVYEKKDSVNVTAINTAARARIDAFLASGEVAQSVLSQDKALLAEVSAGSLADVSDEIKRLRFALTERDRTIADLKRIIDKTFASRSWRITAPIRRVSSLLRKVLN
ncbi:MAG: methyltransferase domain-containing protein [Rhodoferax sp.]|nr:methyltransferase domain-containing protein [Rhodoferax sp.]